jgi:hypothetical protein
LACQQDPDLSINCHEQAGLTTWVGIIVQGMDSGITATWLPGEPQSSLALLALKLYGGVF